MKGLFRADGPLVESLGKAADAVLLSLSWLLASLPVVTMLPAAAALYRTALLCLRGEQAHALRTFWRRFRQELRGGLVPSLSAAAFTLLNALWYTFSGRFMPEGEGLVYLIISRTLLLVQLLGSVFLIPLFASRSMGTPAYWKNAYYLVLRQLPRTLGGVLLFAAAGLALIIFPPLLLVVPAVTAVLHTYIADPVMAAFLPDTDRAAEEEAHLHEQS